MITAYFNPRSREGSDAPLLHDGDVEAISIHAPVKGATRSSAGSRPCRRHFNPRSREGSDDHAGQGHKQDEDFNPRSREGSDRVVAALPGRIVISIHAPVKGATRLFVSPSPDPPNFNPRSREGSDCAQWAR